MKEQLELVTFLWPVITYKVLEFFKRLFGASVTITSSHGPITGIKMSSRFDFAYINFLGIPYGKPPVGNLRFKDPEPVDPWTAPFHTSSETACAQIDFRFNRLMGSEDCLHLNIYTKDLKPKVLYPVMVYLHGGAFMYGSNNKDLFSPEYLLRKDVIVAVINYRLGVLGFLSIDDPTYEVPGNAGLKDQVLALKWLKENCKHFGGNPNDITIFGESAGGCSVHYHMISDISKGLFHKAIAMSGTALNPWAMGSLENIPQRLAKTLGWNSEGGLKQVMQILLKASPESLIKAQHLLIGIEEQKKHSFTPFGPVIEPYRSKQCFIDKHPVIMCLDPWSREMPLLIGGCSAEGLVLYKIIKKKPETLTEYSTAAEVAISLQIIPDRNSERCKYFESQIKKYYFGYTEPCMANVNAYMTMIGDGEFWHGIHRTLVSRCSFENGGPTYLYRFDFDSENGNYSKIFYAGKGFKGLKGACHADDCFYLFRNAVAGRLKKESKEFETMDRMVTIWTNFAKNGHPNDELIKLSCDVWEPITRNKPFKCLNIADDLEFIELPESERMGVWDSIYENANFYGVDTRGHINK